MTKRVIRVGTRVVIFNKDNEILVEHNLRPEIDYYYLPGGGASFLHFTISTAAQYKLDPELLVQRLRRKREGSKLWDEILVRVSNLTVLIVVPVVAGLDIGPRYPFKLNGIEIT